MERNTVITHDNAVIVRDIFNKDDFYMRFENLDRIASNPSTSIIDVSFSEVCRLHSIDGIIKGGNLLQYGLATATASVILDGNELCTKEMFEGFLTV